MTYKQPISTLIVVHTSDLKVLLIERADRPGFWQSVTGSIELGEQIEETAARELAEETGFTPNDGELTNWHIQNQYEIYETWRHRYAPGVTSNTEHVFGFKLPTTKPVTLAAKEHISYRWVNWETAAEVVFSPSNREAILLLGKKLNT
ncbi:dihydroneopterin triphosphate diphosphatase [Leeia sp. TBRC 13508]|uniref:Dihydroneopterin triphosphate diphosphatase n=1 Tax=Leeia speluncae TaxID=2884804 RepID=A0ABS8D907_9NEIS|nr:dihydroneopterin triphosphate diphosphatase [Leeia speluncae]MCB6184607.1 dihydroneopterin triphosphate diphosphatase [Leeia speluncae]